MTNGLRGGAYIFVSFAFVSNLYVNEDWLVLLIVCCSWDDDGGVEVKNRPGMKVAD